ncbi:protein kinase [Kribbella sp. NPDC051770]|uniref:serine/threonine-protein kinase n=1 Tax=Kribbella sp. NPDC051770 TaxID=3155413 RepID=UPI0034344042
MDPVAGRYQLIDLIGTGGMGSVWRAWDLRKHTYVAAKVLGQHDAGMLLRFVREQSLRIQHPHVVAPHGWAAEDDKVVFAMDLVAGGSLATLLGDHGPLPTPYVAVLLDQLLHGLSAIHAAGVVHRDLKPANLLLEATGTGLPHLRISDFGIAGLVDEPRMTRHSTILGTPGYLPPEQLQGADPDPRQDLYTVGAVATELLTGLRPPIPTPPGPLAELITHLTAESPAARPTTATEAARLLAASGALPPPGATPWTTTPDPPEVFNQLPPLPHPWTPTGPVAGQVATSAPQALRPLTGVAAPGTTPTAPPAGANPTPAAHPTDPSPPASHPSRTAHVSHPDPSLTASSADQSAEARPPAGRAAETAAPPAQPQPPAAPSAQHRPAVQASGSAYSAARSSAARGPGAPQAWEATPQQAAPGVRAGSRRALVWVAVGSFVGALGLLAAAVWVLLQ